MILTAIILSCVSPIVHDGDSIRCPGGRGMRLAAIDAPELAGSLRCRRARADVVCDDRAGRASRDHLRGLVAGRRVTCTVVDASPFLSGFQPTDRYGRPVVRCIAGGQDLGSAQRRAGMAVAWPRVG